MKRIALFVLALLTFCTSVDAQEKTFAELVGQGKQEAVKETGPIQVPFIIWGGDVATFNANGGLDTTPASIYGKSGLNFKFVPGDDFIQQVRDYRSGKSPYLRGTVQMIGQAADVVGGDPQTKPVIVLQMTYSLGDHMVAIDGIKTLNDLKMKRVALQRGGPHLALVDDALRVAGLKWSDITPVWCDNLTGDGSSSEKLRKGEADAACVISPDMIGLCGGLDQKGTGAEGSLKGAHVLVSTAQANRSIADVYAVRSDYYAKNRDKVEKFVAGYLKSAVDLMAWKKAYNDGKGKSVEYVNTLKMAQKIYGDKVLPTIEVDAHGLVADAQFVGLPGNISFFEDSGNLNGFAAKQKQTLDLVTSLGLVKNRFGFEPSRLDYHKIAKLAGIEYVDPTATTGRIQAETVDFTEELDSNTIFSFTIKFEPNDPDFSADTNGAEFQRIIEGASTFGNAVFVLRGHSDPTATLKSFLKAGMEKGIITRTGKSEAQGGKGYSYFLRGKPFDVTSTKQLLEEIQSGNFVGASEDPNEVLTAAHNLSQTRANAMKKALADYAKKSGFNLDVSQIRPVGVGIREPIFPKPANLNEAKENMRGEVILIKVNPESIKQSDFDF